MTASEIWYVYGVAPASVDLRRAPEGVDDAAVQPYHEGEFVALVSQLDGVQYAPASIEEATANVEWLAPRAVAHDRVLTWASDRGPIIPLPIFSLFSSAEAVRRMLRDRQTELTEALRRTSGGREYALRVYRLDDELTKVAAELSPRLAELEAAARTATPGQRYLLERKLDSERRTELHAIGARIARHVMRALRSLALDSAEERIVARARTSGEAPLVLDAAFLIALDEMETFQRELTEIVERHTARGFRFDFTGPWPPYHFVQRQPPRSSDDA
jgi:hypothetical protein